MLTAIYYTGSMGAAFTKVTPVKMLSRDANETSMIAMNEGWSVSAEAYHCHRAAKGKDYEILRKMPQLPSKRTAPCRPHTNGTDGHA